MSFLNLEDRSSTGEENPLSMRIDPGHRRIDPNSIRIDHIVSECDFKVF
jgi:hypothetical protein